jgi:hypothetical protein
VKWFHWANDGQSGSYQLARWLVPTNAPGSRYPGVEARSEFLNTGRLMGTNACDNRSRCLVNRLHSFFIHPATVHFDFRESSFDLPKIRGR